MPLFTIVLVHYQGATRHDELVRGVNSIKAQTFRDFELLAYHNGPLLDTSLPMPVEFRCSERNQNDWGFSNRDRGIREATGDYIIHFSSDNILYPHALATLAAEIARPPRLKLPDGRVVDSNDIVIFPVAMVGLQRVNGAVVQFKGSPPFFTILTGNPVQRQNIDCMQLVMKRQLWLNEGGWADKREMSDGYQYERFARKYGYRECGPVLGEHH